jgi:hypothetical protein
MFRARTRQFVSALLDAVGEPDPSAVIQSFMTRQSLQRCWGKFQVAHPLILAPVYIGLPFDVGTDLTTDEVAGIIRGMRMVLAIGVGSRAVHIDRPAVLGVAVPDGSVRRDVVRERRAVQARAPGRTAARTRPSPLRSRVVARAVHRAVPAGRATSRPDQATRHPWFSS